MLLRAFILNPDALSILDLTRSSLKCRELGRLEPWEFRPISAGFRGFRGLSPEEKPKRFRSDTDRRPYMMGVISLAGKFHCENGSINSNEGQFTQSGK